MRVKLAELPEFAGNVLANIWIDGVKDGATVVALVGELGSGKTTFVQALMRRLGIKEIIQSPTYVLMKSYPLEGPITSFGAPRRFNRVVHIDAYRLDKPEQFSALKPQEFLNDPKALVLVEWPERLGSTLPGPSMTITFAEGSHDDDREITIDKE